MKFTDIQDPISIVLAVVGWAGFAISTIRLYEGLGSPWEWVYTALPFWLGGFACSWGYDWIIERRITKRK